MLDNSKMASSMAEESKIIAMAIRMRVNLSMGFLRVTAFIFGMMAANIKVTSSKVIEMAMESGKTKEKIKHFKDITCLTKNMDMEFTYGATVTAIKETTFRTYAQEMGSFSSEKKLFMMGSGSMDKEDRFFRPL